MTHTHWFALEPADEKKRNTFSDLYFFFVIFSFSASFFCHDARNIQPNKPTLSSLVLLMWFPNRHEWTPELRRKNGTKTLTKTYTVDEEREGWSIFQYIEKKRIRKKNFFFFSVCIYLFYIIVLLLRNNYEYKVEKRLIHDI